VFAQVGKALANPHRLELLDLLAQGERSVEALARRSDISLALASAHLQALRRTGLVASRREGNRILYRLADDDVYVLLGALRTVGSRLGDAERAARRYLGAPMEAVSRQQLLERVRDGDAVIVDLRPSEEFEAGHIAGALSIPLPELEARLAELPLDVEIVAYCRGPYCAMSAQAVALLERLGRRGRRLEDGYPEWRLAGLPVAVGTEDAR
jgi:rhodanese-related sulfurtransferase/DNA-binding transcriptional ArsR family regulator